MNKRTLIRFPRLILPIVIPLLFASCSYNVANEVDFNAYYTNYDDADKISGEFADIVIRFPDQKKFVFSRASSYLPFSRVCRPGARWPTEGGDDHRNQELDLTQTGRKTGTCLLRANLPPASAGWGAHTALPGPRANRRPL